MREGKNRDNSEMGQKKGRHETIGENEGGKEEGDGRGRVANWAYGLDRLASNPLPLFHSL